jgi:RNA polymerase sigma-70 factor, ECF subfamily
MSTGPATPAQLAAQAAVRNAYGRLVAWLAWQWRDVAAAEDALSQALVSALQTWPRDGVPQSPEGWLMTAAKRNLLKVERRRRLAEDPSLTVLHPNEQTPATLPQELPDDRLRLMLVCAHPAIDASVRCALMLQTVLGLDAARIARGFLVAPETLSKRLVRAKAKIRAARIRFEEPEAADLPMRISAVLEAIYAAYTLDWDSEDKLCGESLAEEAWFLADLVAKLLPADAEALGLLALIELCQARRPAQTGPGGEIVALEEQDPLRWDATLIARAAQRLHRASSLRQVGPLQLQAAIQMAHCSRLHSGKTPWDDIQKLYEGLLSLHPTVGAMLGYAMACAYASGDAARGLRVLDAVDSKARERHQPWWATRAHLLALAERVPEASAAFDRAMALTASEAMRLSLARRQMKLVGKVH